MRRDWNVIRSLLLNRLDPSRERFAYFTAPDPIRYHADLAVKAGYLSDDGGYELTWKGHELAEMIRDEMVWARCQAAIEANAGGLPTDLLVEIASAALRLRVRAAIR